MKKPLAVALMGPTASGKTAAALEIAQQIPSEIISVDSALVYRGMDIGTAKPTADELGAVPHHLIDVLDPSESYSVRQFRDDALRLVAEIQSRGRLPLLVGGRLRMHTIPTFVSLVGGVISFGPAGLILGPAILTITVFLIGFWRQDPVPANRILSQQQGTSASDSALQDQG